MTDKAALRRAGLAARAAESARSEKERAIGERLRALADYRRADLVCWYVGIRSEVATLPRIEQALGEGRATAVPYCYGETLALCALRSLDDLAPARFGLLEPRAELRSLAERLVPVATVDLFVVPGVVFDRRGGRVGYGRGFYDRLLSHARPDARFVGLAFESQLVPEVPADEHDVAMHYVVTENQVYSTAR